MAEAAHTTDPAKIADGFRSYYEPLFADKPSEPEARPPVLKYSMEELLAARAALGTPEVPGIDKEVVSH